MNLPMAAEGCAYHSGIWLASEATMSVWRAFVIALAAVLGLSAWQPASAQPVERPANCEEVLAFGDIFIGHNCGEVASVVVAGRIVIRRPWSRVNEASRAERLQRRGGAARGEREAPAGTTPTPTAVPAPPLTSASTADDVPSGGAGTRSRRAGNGGSGDVDCGDFDSQEEAQRYFDRQGFSPGNDPFSLDANNDGVPCEDLPSRKG
jgi:hypothetical protein